MRAILISAGRGTRLLPNKNTPKCLSTCWKWRYNPGKSNKNSKRIRNRRYFNNNWLSDRTD